MEVPLNCGVPGYNLRMVSNPTITTLLKTNTLKYS